MSDGFNENSMKKMPLQIPATMAVPFSRLQALLYVDSYYASLRLDLANLKQEEQMLRLLKQSDPSVAAS